jgi:hypothetical protein
MHESLVVQESFEQTDRSRGTDEKARDRSIT